MSVNGAETAVNAQRYEANYEKPKGGVRPCLVLSTQVKKKNWKISTRVTSDVIYKLGHTIVEK